MKRYAMFVLACLMLATSLLSGCRPKEQPLYVMLMWHQHQPYYAPDENGVYTRPWARVHATKDYYDMAAILKDYPKVHVTFNRIGAVFNHCLFYPLGPPSPLPIWKRGKG